MTKNKGVFKYFNKKFLKITSIVFPICYYHILTFSLYSFVILQLPCKGRTECICTVYCTYAIYKSIKLVFITNYL